MKLALHFTFLLLKKPYRFIINWRNFNVYYKHVSKLDDKLNNKKNYNKLEI